MSRSAPVLRKGLRAVRDLELLKALQSEIKHELSVDRFENCERGSLEDFGIDGDPPQTQDVVLCKKNSSGEEIAISALLGNEIFRAHDSFPREVLMKVCVRKAGLSSVLLFDCKVFTKDQKGSEFDIQDAYYIPSSTSVGSSVYRGPLFSTLDPELQDELKQYLVARGIRESLTNFLLHHLHKKEQGQYVNWLRKLEEMLEKSE